MDVDDNGDASRTMRHQQGMQSLKTFQGKEEGGMQDSYMRNVIARKQASSRARLPIGRAPLYARKPRYHMTLDRG